MNSYTLKCNSWHYWLAVKGGLWNHDTDICTYIRKVIVGFVKVTFMSLITLGMILLFGFGLYEIVTWAFFNQVVSFAGLVTAGSIIAFGFLFIAGYASLVISNITEKEYNKEPGFITLAYRKFKDKTCVRVRVK